MLRTTLASVLLLLSAHLLSAGKIKKPRNIFSVCSEIFSEVDVEYSRDWVVEVEGGLEEATRLAAEMELEVLGEVLEDSNIFHLRQRSRVRREAAGDLERRLRDNTRVRSFSQQAVHKVVSRPMRAQ